MHMCCRILLFFMSNFFPKFIQKQVMPVENDYKSLCSHSSNTFFLKYGVLCILFCICRADLKCTHENYRLHTRCFCVMFMQPSPANCDVFFLALGMSDTYTMFSNLVMRPAQNPAEHLSIPFHSEKCPPF